MILRTLQRVGAGLLALTLAGGIAACGDDDDDGDSAAFCDSVVEFNTAVSDVDLEDASEEDVKAAGEQLAPVFDRIASNAPEDLSDTADEINTAVQALLEGDDTAFDDDKTFETYTEFLGGAIDTCGFEGTDVTARDYAFDAPATLAAGTIAFELTNSSDEELHEMVILQKADGVDLTWDEILSLPEEEGQSKTKFVTAAFAPPGESGATLATLDAGDYVMVCFIPVGSGDEGPPHFTQGMVHEFTAE